MEWYAKFPAYDEYALEFTFTIKGKKGVERKKVKFSKTQYSGAYNFSLGTIKENGNIDYSDVTNSGDLINLGSKNYLNIWITILYTYNSIRNNYSGCG